MMIKQKRIFIAFLFCALTALSAPAFAAKKGNAAKTNLPSTATVDRAAQDRTDTLRIEKYLNGIEGFQAEFTQINDNGGYRHGLLEILRPGKMRVVYDPPSKDFIVADGHFVNIWDGEMQQQTSIPIDASLGDLLLRDNINLSDGMTVTNIERGPGKIELTVEATKDPGAGRLTFVLEDNPLNLRAWRVLDAQGRMTTVTLDKRRDYTDFPSGHFTFVPPNFGKSLRNNRK